MKLIVCVDKKNGMMFNNRRVSRDRILIQDVCKLVGKNKLWISNYSLELFSKSNLENLIIDNDMLKKANKIDYCFIEDINIDCDINKVHEVILYNWNRDYPADKYFDLDLENWNQIEEDEFIGSSHDCITKKIYVRGEM